MKRIWTFLLALTLLISITAPAASAAQASGTAATLRLEATEGTTKVASASGKALASRPGMRLYDGYEISTEKASYAFISLDAAKAVKLDASSAGKVTQSGKKLEVTLTAGKLFFNVSQPVKSNESLNIRSSTMVTGVRGTSGWMEYVDRHTTRISLLEGSLSIISIDPQTNTQRTVSLTGGQTATIVFQGMDNPLEGLPENATIQDLIESGIIQDEHIILTGAGLTVEALQEEDVPGFVAVEVAKDPELQKKIEELTDLSVPVIIDKAEEQLAAEEAAANDKESAIQDAVDQLNVEEVEPVFEGEEPAGETGGGGGGTVVLDPIPFEGNTNTELNDALSAANGAPVQVNSTVRNDGTPISVPAGETMVLESGADLGGSDIDVTGTLSVAAGAEIENSGTINVDSTNSLEISGILVNTGIINVGGSDAGALRILPGGQLLNEGNGGIYIGAESDAAATGLLEVQSGGLLTVSNGNIHVGQPEGGAAGTMTIASGATVTGSVIIANTGTLTNYGTINGFVENGGTLNHYGTISGGGSEGALRIEQNSTTLISGATVQNGYHAGGAGSQIGTGDGYALVLRGGSMDPNDPVKITIENGSLIQSSGTAISSRDGYSGVLAYGFQITIKNSTIKSNTYAIDGSTFGAGESDDEEPVTITSSMDITNSTLVGGTAAINENPSAVIITMDAATEENNQSAAENLHRYTVYFHDNYQDTVDGPFTSSDEFIGGIPRSLSPFDWSGRSGYTQTGWNTKPDGSGTAYELNQTLTEAIVPEGEDAIILYAQWDVNQFTVTFDLNGADAGQAVPEPMQNVTYESTFTLPDPATPPVKGNLFFVGWYDEYNDLLAPGETISQLNVSDGGEYTFTAAWADYKIVYHKGEEDASGETAPSYHFKDGDTAQYFSACGFTRDNYFFVKWCDSTDTFGDEFSFSITDLSAYVEAQNITDGIIDLYAQWWPEVTLYANDGTDTEEVLRLPRSSGMTQSLSSLIFTREGYTLSGWNTQADGTGTSYAADHTFQYNVSAVPVTLYAQWTPN